MEIETRNTQMPVLTENDLRRRIELRAYELYLDRGRLDGFHEQDWLQAEDEIINSIVQPLAPEAIRGVPQALKKAAKHA
jgi:hypothetical protein